VLEEPDELVETPHGVVVRESLNQQRYSVLAAAQVVQDRGIEIDPLGCPGFALAVHAGYPTLSASHFRPSSSVAVKITGGHGDAIWRWQPLRDLNANSIDRPAATRCLRGTTTSPADVTFGRNSSVIAALTKSLRPSVLHKLTPG
jgi:hypothetical protein